MTEGQKKIEAMLLSDIENNPASQQRRLCVDAYQAFAQACLIVMQTESLAKAMLKE